MMNKTATIHEKIVVDVHIGQAHTLHEEGTLKAILGSCVGVALFWRAQRIHGLAHCLLPEHPSTEGVTDARYVNHGILTLLDKMNVPPSAYREIEAVIAGGGNMTAPKAREPLKLVGALNGQAAKRWIDKLGLKLIHSDLGGDHGRRILLFCDDGSFRVEQIPKLGE